MFYKFTTEKLCRFAKKKSLKRFLPLIYVLLKFFGVYILLTMGYQFYLEETVNYKLNLPDPYTEWLGFSVTKFMQLIGYKIYATTGVYEPGVFIYLAEKPVSIVNEGCNAISIMIIFLAFIIAFSKGWRNTLWFCLFGLLVIFIFNYIRIVLLNYIILEFPDMKEFGHDILFPLIIYGTILLLWLAWLWLFVFEKSLKFKKS